MIQLSTSSILHELSLFSDMYMDIDQFCEAADEFLGSLDLSDKQYNKITRRLNFDILDPDEYVKKNGFKCVSNPSAFTSSNIPSKDGLLSNEIFGFTMEERMGTFGYIDLIHIVFRGYLATDLFKESNFTICYYNINII